MLSPAEVMRSLAGRRLGEISPSCVDGAVWPEGRMCPLPVPEGVPLQPLLLVCHAAGESRYWCLIPWLHCALSPSVHSAGVAQACVRMMKDLPKMAAFVCRLPLSLSLSVSAIPCCKQEHRFDYLSAELCQALCGMTVCQGGFISLSSSTCFNLHPVA